jgi:hypothetical protein
MAFRIEFPSNPVIEPWLKGIQESVRPGSRVQNAVRGDISRIVRADHERKMLTNIDRYGRERAPLSPKTLANKRRGHGPSLIPRFTMSRYLSTFVLLWETVSGRSVLSMSFRNFVSRDGFPIPLAHEHGARRGNWRLPARPVMGITPSGINLIDSRFAQFATEVARGH